MPVSRGRPLVAEERVERRLAAILCADVAGYSRLMGADEEATHAALKAHRRELIDPLIATHQGRIVKTTGDGMLIEFPSVVDAVRCAVVVQQGMESRDANLPEDRRIRFRVGINVGDIIVEAGDIFGDGVNVAARLEALAEPGAICVSAAVKEQVGEKLPVGFIDLGAHAVKNIARPVHVYRVEARAADAERPTLALPDKPSIAVLPFQNMSGDAEQDYFCDGMVEDIITGLSRIRWLMVIARNSSFIYKGRAADVKQVGRELGVRYVLEGSVRKAGNRVRITGQLIDATNGAHLWAERYDRPFDDIFALQDEITLSVVGAIEPSLRLAEIDRVKRKRPENLGAYDLVLRAFPSVAGDTAEVATKALPLLEQALALEPDYGFAHALAGWCYQTRFIRGGNRPEDSAAAIRHAHAAIASGGDDATALAIAGFVSATVGRDDAAARDAFDRALVLSPSNIFARGYGAVFLATRGETDRAIDWAERALRLSPFDPLIRTPLNALAIAYFSRGAHEKAVDAARRSVRANPRLPLSLLYLAAPLVRLGRISEAKQVAADLLAIQPTFRISTNGFARLGFQSKLAALYEEALRAAGLPE
jgi:adenylate cyclase